MTRQTEFEQDLQVPAQAEVSIATGEGEQDPVMRAN